MADVEVKFGAKTGEAEEGIKRVVEKLKDLPAPIREVLEAFGELRKTLVEAFAARELAEFIDHMAELGEAAIRNSEMLGISVEKVQELGFAARMVGGDSEGMATSMMRLERNMAEASDGSSKAAQAFQALGISQEQLKNSSPEQVLGLIANSFHGAQDGADKTAIAMELMGRAGAQMIPLLNQGSEGLEKMGVIARSTGSILTEVQAEGLEKTAQSITTLKASVEGLGISAFNVFKPFFDTIIDGLTTLTEVLRSVIKLIEVAAIAIENDLLLGLAAVIEQGEEMGARISAVFNLIQIKAHEVGEVLTHLAHGELQEAVNAQRDGEREAAKSNQEWQEKVKKLREEYENLRNKIEAAGIAAAKNTLGIGEKEEKEDNRKKLHAPTSGGKAEEDNTEEQIALDKIKTEEELAKIGLQTQKDLLDQEVAAKQISKVQELATLQSYLGLEYQVQKDALDKKLALEAEYNGEDSREYAQTLNEKVLLNAKYQQQLARLAAQGAQAQAEAAKKTNESFKQIFDLVGRDFDTMLTGVLQGTQTWGQAMDNMFSNIASSAVAAIGKIIAEWVLFEAVTLGQGTWTDFMAFAEPNGGGILHSATNAIRSYDVGTWSVPVTGPALLHQGEIVLPPDISAGVRAGTASVGNSGGSGGSTTININAIDTQTGAAFLKNNAAVIAQALSGQVRNANPNLKAAWS